jgi:hypothetical protein
VADKTKMEIIRQLKKARDFSLLRYDFNYLFSTGDAIDKFGKWTMVIG